MQRCELRGEVALKKNFPYWFNSMVIDSCTFVCFKIYKKGTKERSRELQLVSKTPEHRTQQTHFELVLEVA